MSTLFDLPITALDGAEGTLDRYRGQVLLIVNVASACGYTPQYAGLETLHRELGPRGLAVLGFPCNQFGAQEPGTAEEIKTFCSTKYDVTFPMFQKLDVNGEAQHPLYAWLSTQDTKPEGPGAIKWNFGKFLIDRSGNIVARFNPSVGPADEPLLTALAPLLG